LRFTSGVHTAAPEFRVLRTRQGQWARSKQGYPQHLQPFGWVAPRISLSPGGVFHNGGERPAAGVADTGVACFPQEAENAAMATSGSQEESKTG
jgi:hypothetical protein